MLTLTDWIYFFLRPHTEEAASSKFPPDSVFFFHFRLRV